MINSRTTLRLLRGGVPVTVRDGFKLDESTLHWACSFNDIEVAKLLLLWGIPVDTTNKDGQTALHLACKTVNVGMIKLLLSEGASVAAVDSSGNMPKSLLLESNEEIESLLNNPPEPTFALQNMFHKSQLALDSATAAEQSVKEIAIPPIAVSAADQLLGTSSNGKHSTSNGSSSGLTYSDRDGQDYGDKGKTEPDNHKESPLLVLWPPAKRQTRRGQETLDLNSRDTLLIHVACEVMDILPILSRSGLIDVLEQFNFRTSVKRPASDNAGADVAGVAPARAAAPAIRFCVDSGLCPGRHRFEIEVCLQYISVLASDRQGGLYGLYALGQLLQLHSEVTYSEEGDVLLAIPAISLSDWPDVMNRAVMWSFRDRARGSFQVMRETFELLSRLRVDMVLLVIDTTSVKDAMDQEKVENEMRNAQIGSKAQIDSDKSLLKAENEESEKMTATYITALDEICEGVCVELVPTVSITSVTQRLSLSLLKSFSNTMMCVMFNFDLQSVRNDLKGQRLNEDIEEGEKEGEKEEEEGGGGGGERGVVTDAQCNDACIAACEAAFHTASLIGYTAIIFSCTKWVRTVANPRVSTLCVFRIFTFLGSLYPRFRRFCTKSLRIPVHSVLGY
jgi:Ankyrin repeats (many copies)